MSQVEWDTFAGRDALHDLRRSTPITSRQNTASVVKTVGPWGTEEETCAAFDAAIEGDPRFSRVYKQVKGFYLSRDPHEEHDKDGRIDRILIPSPELRRAGWLHGPIGVEVKSPETKIGRPISQCIDYMRAAFEVRRGFHMPIGMVFLFAVRPLTGDLESVMVQQGIGTCDLDRDGRLDFRRGKQHIVSVREKERNFIPRRKVGSR